jgi:MFS family permease
VQNVRRVTSVEPASDSGVSSAKAPAATGDFAGIGRRLDQLPVTYLHLAIMAVCAFGFTFDLLELGLGSVMTAVFSVSPSDMGASRLSWLLSAAFIGAIVGAPSLGWYAERHGPKRTLGYALALLAPASLALAGSREYGAMLAMRLLSGVALGAYPPLMIAYLTEIGGGDSSLEVWALPPPLRPLHFWRNHRAGWWQMDRLQMLRALADNLSDR